MTYSQPFFPLLVLFTLVALVRQWRRSTGPKPWLLSAAIAGQLFFTLPLVSGVGSWTLERGYALHATPPEDAEAIVVLSGAVFRPRIDQPAVILGSDTYTRCQHAAWLFKNWKPLPVLTCGGVASSSPDVGALAEVMRDALQKEGVPNESIWCESRSKSTHQNAVYAAEILREKGIKKVALVTDAFHMLRAEQCFLKQGIEVVPAPCGFRSRNTSFEMDSFLPSATPIRRNEQTLHEWVALVWYWLQGQI